MNHFANIMVGKTDSKTRSKLQQNISRVHREVWFFDVDLFFEDLHHHPKGFALQSEWFLSLLLSTWSELEVIINHKSEVHEKSTE